jgi:hypothetical protein
MFVPNSKSEAKAYNAGVTFGKNNPAMPGYQMNAYNPYLAKHLRTAWIIGAEYGAGEGAYVK